MVLFKADLPQEVTVWKSLGVERLLPPKDILFIQGKCTAETGGLPDAKATYHAEELNHRWHRAKSPQLFESSLWSGAIAGVTATNMTYVWHFRLWVPIRLGRRWRRTARRNTLITRLLLCHKSNQVQLPQELITKITEQLP